MEHATTINELPRVPVIPAPRCPHSFMLFGDEVAKGISLNCPFCRQPVLLPHILSEREQADLWDGFMGEHTREQKRQANWKSIDELARSVAADEPDSESFAEMWSRITGKQFNLQTFRWALKKARHFRALYAGLGAEDFGILA